jgi:lipoyl-dependent peroxiredoxin
MALAHMLAEAEHTANRVETTAQVHFEPVDGVPTITRIELSTEGDVPDVDEAEFQRQASAAKEGCAVSRALAGVEISLEATLVASSASAA